MRILFKSTVSKKTGNNRFLAKNVYVSPNGLLLCKEDSLFLKYTSMYLGCCKTSMRGPFYG